jgi:rubrerythrin
MDNLRYECKECGCTLWSNHSKKLGVCPECKDPDAEPKDLESMLESLINRLEQKS